MAIRAVSVVVVRFEPRHTEEIRVYLASSLAEALTMAEREDAGCESCAYAIRPEDFPQADAEGIPYNQADGLLMDPPPTEK